MSSANSYRILELSIGASQPDVRAAYHRLVRQWHPDKFHDDPEKQRIAELKIREIIGAYTRLSTSSVTQRDAVEVPEGPVEADHRGHSPSESQGHPAFYSSLEEAIRSGTRTSRGHPQNARDDAASACHAAAESLQTGRAACAYVGGDPRLEHLATGFLGCSAVVTWNSAGVTLSATGAANVVYPARSIRSVRMARRSALAFLSEGTVRIQVTDPASVYANGFSVKLRFPDRYSAELVAGQLGNSFAVETCLHHGRPYSAKLLILMLVVLAGLGISIILASMHHPMLLEPAQRPVVNGNQDGDRDPNHAAVAPVAHQKVTDTDADAQAIPVAEIQRSGGSVIQSQGKILRVKLAGARIDESLLEHISGLHDLEELNLHATTITGEEFGHLSELSNLNVLDLGSTRNAAAGVMSLIGLTGLQILRLSNTDVGDAELKLLEQLPDLQEVEVIHTQVTEIGIEQFNALRPDCVVVR